MPTLTQAQAKEITLEIWQYLADHPHLDKKSQIPQHLYNKVEYLRNDCPLCELFYIDPRKEGDKEPNREDYPKIRKGLCPRCPLAKADEQCFISDFTVEERPQTAYENWCDGDESRRKQGALRIVEVVTAWKPRAPRKVTS